VAGLILIGATLGMDNPAVHPVGLGVSRRTNVLAPVLPVCPT
jgi:hypothetical protein